MLFVHGPVIVDIIDYFRRDLYNLVLLFLIELIKFFGLIEDGFIKRRLFLAILLLIFLVLVRGDWLTCIHPPLTILLLVVFRDHILIVLLPL